MGGGGGPYLIIVLSPRNPLLIIKAPILQNPTIDPLKNPLRILVKEPYSNH